MPIRDVAAMNASLDNDYGTTRGPNAADSHEVALFDSDPTLDGVELSGGGYARVPIAPEDWSVSAGGSKSTFAQFADSTGAWSATATWWGLVDAGDHATVWDCAALNVPIDVASAGPGPGIELTVFYSSLLDD